MAKAALTTIENEKKPGRTCLATATENPHADPH